MVGYKLKKLISLSKILPYLTLPLFIFYIPDTAIESVVKVVNARNGGLRFKSRSEDIVNHLRKILSMVISLELQKFQINYK